MIKSLNTAATGMQAQQTNMDVIANNMANVNTSGFKKSRAEFEDLLYHTQQEPGSAAGANAVSPNGVQVGLGVRTASVQKDFDMGSAKLTNAPLDMMIEGNGFFQIQTADGQITYTRDGSFKKGPEGQIMDKNGNLLIPQITIPPGAAAVDVSAEGQVSVLMDNATAPEVVGQIDIVNFINPAGLRALGKNLFSQSPSSGAPVQSRPGLNGTGFLSQGQLESSNVNIVDEMVNMITAQRAYETNSKVIQAADQMLQSVNNLR